MNANIEICDMKNQKQQNMYTISGIFVLIVGGLITLCLLFLKYHNVLNIDIEVVLAPFVIISLLTYGDKLLTFLFLSFICFASKLFKKVRGSQQQLTLKES